MKVTHVNVINPGRGWFDEPPQVTLHGGGGNSAMCRARVKEGRVVSVEVVDGGVNYAAAPEVRFSGGGGAVGTGTVAEAVVGTGGRAFADQPVPKPENPPKDPRGTVPVQAETPLEDRKSLTAPKAKGTPDEPKGMQHVESTPHGVRDTRPVTEQARDERAQFNPGGNPLPGDEKQHERRETTTAPAPVPQPKPAPKPAPKPPIPPAAPHQSPTEK